MITLLDRHSNVANNVYDFIADTKEDLETFETQVKGLLKGKMCGTHSKVFVVETGSRFYWGADGTLTEVPKAKVDNSVTAGSTNAVSGGATYNAIQALFSYDETTQTLNVTPIS